MTKRLYILLLTLAVGLSAAAQRLTADAPKHVATGDQFRLCYTIDTHDVSDFRAGKVPEAFEVLMGPSRSQQDNYQIINGKSSQSHSVTFTYILCANKPGEYVIPAGVATVGGRAVRSNAVHISVQKGAAAQPQTGGHSGSNRPRAAEGNISSSDLYITVTASKRRVREQEPVMLTYKVYTLVDLTNLSGKMPELKGFHIQEIPLPQQKSLKLETIGGKPYRTVTWSQYVMFPQLTGKLTIPSITYDAVVVREDRSVDPFEAFFNGGSGYVEMKKKVVAPSVEITVDPLPARPADFSGAVGQFAIKASLSKTKVATGDPVTLRVVVSGKGNMKLMKEPEVKLPADFDKYEAKTTDQTKLTAEGVAGSMVYDIPIVPRVKGDYTLPAVSFTYFDSASETYRTVRSDSLGLSVSAGKNGGGGRGKAVSAIDDIRYIKAATGDDAALSRRYFGSTAYKVALLTLVAAFVVLLIIFRRRAIENADLALKRGRRAGKIAKKRLRKAEKLMLSGADNTFYDEVEKALLGFVSDRLSMPLEQLSRDNIRERLTAGGAGEEIVEMFIKALEECEYERFAPGDSKGNMQKTYDAASKAITALAEQLHKVRRSGAKAKAVVLAMMLVSAAAAMAAPAGQTRQTADSLYADGYYRKAIDLYRQSLKEARTAETYYNLGNAYYRVGELTESIMCYERAAKLAPSDGDISFNLALARSKTQDKQAEYSDIFLVEWYRWMVFAVSANAWCGIAVTALLLALIAMLVYLFAQRIWLRKVGFFGSAAMLLVLLLANVFAWQQCRMVASADDALVVAETQVLDSPTELAVKGSEGTSAVATLHAGSHLRITDKSMKGWYEVKLPNGRSGWVKSDSVEII